MPSALATKLLSLPRAADSVSDLLWRSADFSALTVARAALSDRVFSELSQVLFGERLTALGQAMDRPDRVDLQSSPKELRAGLVANPYVDTALLDALAKDSDGTIRQAACDRLALEARIDAGTPSDEDVQAALKAGYAAVFARLVLNHRETGMGLLARFDQAETTVRKMVFDLLRASGAGVDRFYAELLGSFDDKHAAFVIDDELALWLVSDPCEHAAMCRAVVEESLGDRKPTYAAWLVGSATPDAVSILADSELYAQREHPRASALKLPPHAKMLDDAMLSALRDSGLPVQALAALVFSSAGELSDRTLDRVFNDTVKSSPAQALSYLLGQTSRIPDRQTVTRQLSALNEDSTQLLADTYQKVSTELNGKIPDLPWRMELVRYLPGLFRGEVADDDLTALNRRFSEVLGTDDAAWEFAIALAKEWDGSLEGLLTAAQRI